MYALSQTSVSLAYGLGPLMGGNLVQLAGFPAVMATVGAANLVYAPVLLMLTRKSEKIEVQFLIYEDHSLKVVELQMFYILS